MYNLSSKLWYDKRWISKNGEASLYLQVTLNGKHKEFPLQLKWPADHVDLVNGQLMPRRKKDPDVNDYQLLIMMEQGKHTEILRTYRIRKAPIDIKIFSREVRSFDNRESFVSFMFKQIEYRFKNDDICKRTYYNDMAALNKMILFDKAWPFEMVNARWMGKFKNKEISRGFAPGGVWATIKVVKTYLKYASNETMLYVNPDAVEFSNPMPAWNTTFLNKEEVRRLMILFRAGSLTQMQKRVLAAFLFQCFTSLRISDVYRVNSKWRLTEGFLDFIPKKNEKAHKWVHVPLMPMSTHFIQQTAGVYFDLPSEGEYNIQLKHIAKKAEIHKRLTSHVGRHTFGYIYMTTIGNLAGLKEVMGHSKIETTMRYAHLDDEYQTVSVKKMQDEFSDLILYKVK